VTLETFIVATTVSVAASVVLVACLERVGERWRLSEALLGLVVALAADGPEITSAITAMVSGQRAVGVGVVIGSNVFNLAALLGLGAIIAGRLALPRVSVALEGVLQARSRASPSRSRRAGSARWSALQSRCSSSFHMLRSARCDPPSGLASHFRLGL
jgi:hypothetical protein